MNAENGKAAAGDRSRQRTMLFAPSHSIDAWHRHRGSAHDLLYSDLSIFSCVFFYLSFL